jgi:drug/metabolite transporter (DMT)-like permease
VKGPALLLAGIVLFSLLDANSKLLSGQYGLGQVILIRYVTMLGLFGVLYVARPSAIGPLGSRKPWLHVARACSMMISAAAFFLAFRHIPLAEGYLVFFTAPLVTLALSALVLREAVPRVAWLWTLLGFAGVLLAVLPKLGGGGSAIGYFWVVLGTLTFSTTQTINRFLRDEAGPARILLWPSLLALFLYGPPAVIDWVPPPPLDLLRLALNGLLAGSAIALSAAAYRHADAARLGPFGFAAMPVSVGLDWLLWHHPPEVATLAGGAVVMVACLMSERARRRALLPAGRLSSGGGH